MMPYGLVAVGLFSFLLQQSSAGPASASSRAVLLATSADSVAWAPSGQRISYASGAELVVVDVQEVTRERCRINLSGIRLPIRDIEWSPDGERIAFVGARSSDRLETLWLTTLNCSKPRDVIPAEAVPGSPGIRALAISTWKDPQLLFSIEHCGPGCHTLSAINVDDGSRGGFCTAEGPFHWNRARTRAVAQLHLGALGVVNADSLRPVSDPVPDCEPLVAGCDVVQGREQGTKRIFEGWMADNRHVLVTRTSCTPTPATHAGELEVWDTATNRFDPVARNWVRASASPNGMLLAFLLVQEPRRDQSTGGDFVATASVSVNAAIADAVTHRIERLVPLGTTPAMGSTRDPFAMLERYRAEFRPSWSPDSQQLLMRDTKRNVFLLNIDGSDSPRHLGDIETSWAPAGRRLALVDRASRQLSIIDTR